MSSTVRVRVVDRDARVLGEGDDEEADRGEEERRRGGAPRARQLRAEHPGEGEGARGVPEHEQAQEEGRLGEARERHLARGAHALERGAGVERGEGGREVSPSRYANRMKSPANESAAGAPPMERRSPAASIAASPTTGPARNTHVVVRLYTAPFRRSFARS